MIEVKDRIPTQAGRIKLIDELTGEERYYKLVRADEPLEEGTPINKALFDSIKNTLKDINSYKIPTIEEYESNAVIKINSSISEYSEGSMTKVKVNYEGTEFTGIPTFSNNGSIDGFEIFNGIASSSQSNNAYRAFDNVASTYAYLEDNDSIGITLPYNIVPTKVEIVAKFGASSSAAKNIFEIRGITDTGNDELIKIWSLTPTSFGSGTVYTEKIETNKLYKTIYLKYNLWLDGEETYIYSFSIEGTIKKSINQININELGNKNISNNLYDGYYYDLVYNATNDCFDVVYCKQIDDIAEEIENIKSAIVALGGSI